MGFGRFVCVLVPFGLTLASLIAMLIGGLSGVVGDKSLYMFEVNMTNFQISASEVSNAIGLTRREEAHTMGLGGTHIGSPVVERAPSATELVSASGLVSSGKATSGSSSNLTAQELGLYNLYRVNVWNYCYTAANGTTGCLPSSFDWATHELNVSTNYYTSLITSLGKNVTIPTAMKDAIIAFETVSHWTQIVFVIAYIALGVELFFGFFAECSRAFSCITFIISGFATVAVCAAAALATATAAVVTGTMEATAKWYGVTADLNARYLATVWIGAAFAIAAGFFWMFTICCCAPDHHRRRSPRGARNLGTEGEKLIPSSAAYAPIHDQTHGHAYSGSYGQPSPGFHVSGGNGQGPRRDLAYEPYSHANV